MCSSHSNMQIRALAKLSCSMNVWRVLDGNHGPAQPHVASAISWTWFQQFEQYVKTTAQAGSEQVRPLITLVIVGADALAPVKITWLGKPIAVQINLWRHQPSLPSFGAVLSHTCPMAYASQRQLYVTDVMDSSRIDWDSQPLDFHSV